MANVLSVATDLMFTSKISGTARAVGLTAATVSNLAALRAALASGDVKVVFVDMSMPTEITCDAIAASREVATTIAFYSHVQTQLREAAESAGAHEVMPRSRFVTELPEMLERIAKTSEKARDE